MFSIYSCRELKDWPFFCPKNIVFYWRKQECLCLSEYQYMKSLKKKSLVPHPSTQTNTLSLWHTLTRPHQGRCLCSRRIWYSRRLGCSWRFRPACGWVCGAAGSGCASGSRKRGGAGYTCAARTEDTVLSWTPSDTCMEGGREGKRGCRWWLIND